MVHWCYIDDVGLGKDLYHNFKIGHHCASKAFHVPAWCIFGKSSRLGRRYAFLIIDITRRVLWPTSRALQLSAGRILVF